MPTDSTQPTYADGLAALSAARPDYVNHRSDHLRAGWQAYQFAEEGQRTYERPIVHATPGGNVMLLERGMLHVALLTLARREGIDVTLELAPGNLPQVTIRPSGREWIVEFDEDVTLALLTALAAALSAGGVPTSRPNAPEAVCLPDSALLSPPPADREGSPHTHAR